MKDVGIITVTRGIVVKYDIIVTNFTPENFLPNYIFCEVASSFRRADSKVIWNWIMQI